MTRTYKNSIEMVLVSQSMGSFAMNNKVKRSQLADLNGCLSGTM